MVLKYEGLYCIIPRDRRNVVSCTATWKQGEKEIAVNITVDRYEAQKIFQRKPIDEQTMEIVLEKLLKGSEAVSNYP